DEAVSPVYESLYPFDTVRMLYFLVKYPAVMAKYSAVMAKYPTVMMLPLYEMTTTLCPFVSTYLSSFLYIINESEINRTSLNGTPGTSFSPSPTKAKLYDPYLCGMKKNFFATMLSMFLFFVLTACQSSSDHIESVKGDLAEAFRLIQGSELSPAETPKRQQEGWVYVTKIIDGDTFWVDNGTESFKVRLIGVDAPETRNSARKKKGYYGAESRAYVRSKIEQQWVRLEFDVQATDRYKRKLA